VIRNIVQVIAVEAETGAAVVDFQQALRQKNSDTSIPLTVQNLWAGKKYHFLVLMGHKERTYDEVGADPDIIYKDDLAPTLLAAGFLGDQTVPEGGTTISITMKPLVVDTVFEYGGVTAPAVLGGAELPAGVEARLVWTLTGGGLAVLVDAQNKAGNTSVWGEVKLTDKTTIVRFTAGGGGTESADLGGAEHNRIVLDLGALEAVASGSANFNLAYIPFGFDDMDDFPTFDGDAASWIIRNGVNDEAQNGDTTFSGSPIPWDGTVNGNGAAAFTAAQGSIFTAGNAGTYHLQWEAKDNQAGTSSYSGEVEVSAYSGSVPLFENKTEGYSSFQTLNLTAGEKVDVKVYGTGDSGSYTVRYYR
jgi:hypothetical protein